MRRRRGLKKAVAILLIACGTAAAFWLGLVPQRFSPFSPLDLSEPSPWFLDFKIAALKRDPAVCQATLAAPAIVASPIADEPVVNGCGWQTAVRVREAAGARLSADKLTCPMAAAVALWLTHEVQPAAERHFGASVSGIRHMGTYACRNIMGAKGLKSFRSQHATANAIDISGFQLSNGRSITVLKDWAREGAESAFLREVHRGACRYFRVALGPEFNAAHANHFHFDRGAFKRCR